MGEFVFSLAAFVSVPGALSLFVAVFAAHVALDLARRVQLADAGASVRWLVASAVALGAGITSVHVILAGSLQLPFPLGYDVWATLGSWWLAMAVALLGLDWAGGHVVSVRRIPLGGAALALGIVASQMVALRSLGLRPGIEWHAPRVLVAAAISLALVMPSLWLFYRVRLQGQRRTQPWLALAALGLGVAIVASQIAVIAAANLNEQTFSAFDLRMPLGNLSGAATLGSISLLTMMLVSSLLEAQMRRSLREAKRELQKQSYTDPLTGLPNRLTFEGALAQSARDADTGGGRVALLAIDLDGFKPINETHGHVNGDRILCEIAVRLRVAGGENDMVARLGGDEFLMLVNGNPTREQAIRLAEKLVEVVAQPCAMNGREATVGCSIGIALYPDHGAVTSLIAHAETALRAAKSTGGESACVFETHMMGGAREHAELLRDLRRAVAQREFELHYQPKIHAPSGQVTGAEALLRWNHPQRGPIGPGVFIPIAERFGLIGAMGEWVIDEACRQAREWRDIGLRMRLAINISVHQLRRPDLADHIAAALRRHRLEPDKLTCEITESVAMEDPEGTMEMFERLSAVGVHLSIDDFGTGYSSLAYLRKLPAREVKIDRSFVLDLETSNDARAVVDAVVRLAHALGLKVVAEGVETPAQRDILRGFGCDELQGFLFARPMTARALCAWAMQDGRSEADDGDAAGHPAFRESLFQVTSFTEMP